MGKEEKNNRERNAEKEKRKREMGKRERREKREMEKRERRERAKMEKREKVGEKHLRKVELNTGQWLSGQCKKGCQTAYTQKKNNIERNGEEGEKKIEESEIKYNG